MFSTIYHPRYELPHGVHSLKRYFHVRVRHGAMRRWGRLLCADVVKRLDAEEESVFAHGAQSYFLLLADIVRAARKSGAVFSPGRGAATGSAICYVLGLTDIDPIRYGLDARQLLGNPQLFPDVDFEVDDVGCDFVQMYLTEKYGWNAFDEMAKCFVELCRTKFPPPFRCTKGYLISLAMIAYREAWIRAHLMRPRHEGVSL